MGTNLEGENTSELFSVVGVHADGNAPYTNTGGDDDAATLALAEANDVTVTEAAGAFSGAGNPIAIVLSAEGEFEFEGASGYTGGTEVGVFTVLDIDNIDALGTGGLTLDDYSTLEANVTGVLLNPVSFAFGSGVDVTTGHTLTIDPVTFPAPSMASPFGVVDFGTAQSSGTIVLAPSASFSQSSSGGDVLDIYGGTLALGNSNAASVFNVFSEGVEIDGGTLDLNGQNATINKLSGELGGSVVTDNGAAATLTLGVNAKYSIFFGTIKDGSGVLSLTVYAAPPQFSSEWPPYAIVGEIALYSANTYTGGTTIDEYAGLFLGNGGATGSIVGPIVDNGVLAINRGGAVILNGPISGAGELLQAGPGTLILSGINSLSGLTLLQSGAISIASTTALGSTEVEFTGSDASTLESTIDVTLTNQFWVNSDGAATLAASDDTTMTVIGGLEYDFNSKINFGSSTERGTIVLSSAEVVNDNALFDNEVALAINNGSVELGSAAAATLISGSSSGLSIAAGATLDLGGFSASAYDLSGAGTVTNNGAATTLTVDAAASSTFSGLLENGGGALALDIMGVATFALTGANTFSGGVTVDGGRLDFDQNMSAGTGAITFGSQAYATLVLAAGVVPTNAISLTDATDAIDLAGLAYSADDKLTLVSSGLVASYALENASGVALKELNFAGAFNPGSLTVGTDEAGGILLETAYTAAVAVDDTTLSNASSPIFISDTAANIASVYSKVTSLIAKGIVASIFTNGATLSDGTTAVLDIVGGANSITLADASVNTVDLYGTDGDWDGVTAAGGTIDLDGAQASIQGNGDTITFGGSADDAASLYGGETTWDAVSGIAGITYLTNANASIFGGGQRIEFASGSDDAVSLYDTNGDWDTLAGTKGTVYLTGAQVSIIGGGNSINFGAGLAMPRVFMKPARIGTMSRPRALSSISMVRRPRSREVMIRSCSPQEWGTPRASTAPARSGIVSLAPMASYI